MAVRADASLMERFEIQQVTSQESLTTRWDTNKKYKWGKRKGQKRGFSLPFPLCERREVLTNGSFVIGGGGTPWKPSFTSPEERVLTRDVGGAKWAQGSHCAVKVKVGIIW
ncbi:hypothetical protein CDAR_607861 [Caerostris darwini]|uniref:Uncharacterized protein n=1 Tax=Caerostris darwini TaxID=1538125 RepID=A0AAV4ULA8_9ARAC|nr:hypothetical protein CDAR_607861 [Caerostris darwini]